LFGLAPEGSKRLVGRAHAEQRLRLLKEALVVADEVQNDEVFLFIAQPQAAAQLLKEEDLRLGRPQHHHRVDPGEVHALVEQVNGEDGAELAVPQLLQRLRAPERRPCVNRSRGDARLLKLRRHVLGMPY
jgi:hypothetical protein